MSLRLPFIDLFKKSGLLFALLLTTTLNTNAQGLFTPVASAVNTGGNCYRLTTETVSDRGAIWNNTKISLLSDFDITFTFNFGTRSGYSGGDGMAFVLQPAGLSQIGVAGSAKGWGNNYDGNGNISIPGISPSVVVDYDNYDDNGGTNALLSLLFNGDYRGTNPANVGVAQQSIGFVNDGQEHAQRIMWNAATKTLSVHTDGVLRFAYIRDLVNDIFSGQDEVYFGFTAATGGSVNQYSVCYNAELSTFSPVLIPTLGQVLDACAGGNTGSATINLQGGTNPFIVELNGVAHNVTQSNITANSVTFSNLPADVYSVRILESNGFVNTDLSFTIHDNPTPSITASGPLTFCQGGSVELTASAGTSYLWNTGETTPSITVTTSGNYTVTITNGSCASTSPPFEVLVNPTPSTPILALSGPTEFCEGGSVVISVTNVEGVAYQWLKSVDGGYADPIPGETGTSLTVTTTGRYTVMATSLFCGMIVSGTYEIFVNPKPIINPVTGNATICTGSTSTLTASSPSFGSTFQWSEVITGGGVFGSYARVVVGAGAEFTTPALSANATYEVIATDLNGCESDPQTFTVTVEPALATPTIAASRSLVLCSYNSVVLTSSSATDNTWSNGETTQSITVTPATVGSYTVTVNNGVCSATSEASVVTNAPAFVSSITASGPTLICDGSSVTYTLNETVPSASRTWYRYFEGQYDPTFNETGLSIVVTKSGNYGVNIVDSYGCFSNPPGSHDVTVLPPPIKPLAFTISSTNACTVNSGTVAAIIDFSSGVAPINMTWNDGNGFSTNAQSLNNVSPGTYTATVVDYCGTTVVQAVTITGAVTASAITATATTVCTGATTTLRVSDINPLHTYQWYKDGSIIPGATGTSYEGSAGNYQISASDGSCSAFSESLFISERVVTAPLDFTVTSSNSCAGPNTGMIDQGPFTGGGFSYVNLGWTGPNGFFRDDVSMLSNLEAGTYTLGVRDFCGTVVSKTVTILQGTSFDKNLVINGPQILCSNGASIRITAASGATTYSWNKTINGVETNGFANTEFIDVTEAGVYSVVMTDAIGCQTYSFAYSIAAPNPPLAITAQSSNSCNASNNGTANITSLVGGNIPYTISWSGPNGFTSSQYSINNLGAGVYTVTAQDACGTTVSASVTVLEPAPQPQIMAVSGSTTLCNPESSVTISAYAGAVTYVWQRVVNNVTIPVAGSGNTIVATEPGAYYVSMTDANGCFQNSDLVNVYAANPIPLTVDLTSYTNGVSCFNGGGVANASYSGGTAPITFVGWTGPNGFTSTANNISSLVPGTYIATYRDFCGVEATGSITFTSGDAFALPTVTPSAPFCGSNAVTLTLGATPYSFEWYQYDLINSVYIGKFSPNQNTIVLSTDAGYYYYPVLKDANNCYGYPNGFATTAPTPITFSVSSSPSCGPNSGTANIFNIAGGSYPVTYSWTDGASFNSTDGFITNLAPGTYTVTAMDACANAVSQSVTITGGITTATITSTTQNICSGSSAVLSVTNYNAAYSYQWIKDGVNIPGANGASYAASVQGYYYVRVTDGTCSNDANGIYISVASLPSLTVYSTPSCGAPNSGSAYIQSVSGGSLPFTYSWTDGTSFSSTAEVVNNLAAGNYTVTVTDACGAQDTKSFTINQLPAVIGTITGVPTICTLGGSTILTASTDGTPASYAWHKIIEGVTTYDIASSNTISATEVGYYWVTIRDVNGCFSIPNIAITTTPVATITASGSLTLLSGQTVTLTASAGTSYVWSNGATTPSIVVSTAEVGTYTVTVTNNGCTTTSAPTVVSAAAAILPVINVPADMAVNNDPGTCGAIVNFTATETTGVPASTITYSHAPGSLFPIGITTVTVTAANSAGVSTGTFTVTVTDNEKPTFVITAPGTATVTIPAMQTFVGSCQMIPFNFSDPLPPGAVVTGIDLNYSGQDQGYGYTDGNDDLYVSGTKVASSVYAHETKTFNTSYTGSIPGYVYGGNNVFGFVFTCYPGWQGFINGGTMTIRYTSSFGPKTVNSDAGKCDATLTLTAPNTSDNCGAASVTNDAPATFPVGITNVNWTATDSHGNTNTISQIITVIDNQAPVVTTQNITVALTNGTVSIAPAQVNNGSTDNCGIASYSLDKTSFDCSNVGTNTVTLTVTDIHGNSASATANVIVNSGGTQANITAGGPTTICTGSSVTLTASVGTGYLWSTGETTQSITVSTSGSYTVTVSGSSDCPSTSVPTVVTVNPISTLTITPANPVVCSGSTLILNSTITGGTVATPIVSSLSGGGQASAKLVVGLRRLVSTYGGPAIRLRRSSDNAESDFGFSGNELDLTAINSFLGGSTGFVTTLYDQSGNGGNVTQPATGIQPTFVANGLNGKPNMHMSSSQYMTNSVNYPSPFTVVYAAKQTGPTRGRMLTSVSNNWLLGWWAGLKGLSFFEGWVQPSGGGVSSNGDTNPYLYTGASNGSNSSFLYQNGTLLANNAGGITGPNGISLNRSGPYGEPSDGDFTEVFIFNTVLSTDDRQLVENSTASYYSIYTPVSNVAGPSLTVNPTTTTSYTINAIDVNGCAVSNSITVTVNPLPSATITANGPTTFCSGGSVTLTSSSATGNVWSTGATSQSITVSQSGNYSVSVTDGNGCSAISTNTTVTVNTPPVVTITPGGPTTFCSGGAVTLTASAGSSYLWSTGETTQSITVSQSGNYSVTLTDGNGCIAMSTITSVTVNTPSILTITANGPTSFCYGGSVTLTSSSTTGNIWSTGETSPSITVSQSGNYSVTAADASGCSAVSANTNVTVNTAPVITPIVTASGSTTLCGGGNLGLSVAAMGGSSLRFNGSNYLEAPSAPGNSLSTAFTAELWFKTDNAAATQYLVSKGKSDGAPGQYGLVLVNSRVQLHLGGAGSASINSVTLLQSNTWYHVAGTWDGATGIARLYLNGSYEGQVTTGTNSNLGTNAEPLQIGRLGLSCCPYMYRGEMDEIRIWNVARDAGQIANGRSLSFGNTPNLVANYHFDEGTGAVTYDSAPGGSNATLVNSPTWQVSGAPVNAPNSSYLWSNGETTPNISVNTAGSYTATVTYVTTDGCTATGTSAPVSVTTVQAATVTASGPVTFCPGGSVILTASAGSAYAWSNGATTQSITVTQSGNYTVSVTNGLGCTTVSAPVAVSVTDITAPVPDLPSLPVISITPNGLITAPTATDDCSGVSVTGTTTDQVTNLLSGTYTITWNYIDASGNSSSQTQTVIVADVAPPSLKAMNRIVKNNDPGVCGAMVTYVMPVANDNASTTKVTINEGGGDGVITFNTPLSQNVTSLDFISAGEYQDIVHGHGVDIAIQVELYNPQTAVWTLVQTVQTGTTDYHFGGTSVQFPAISQVSQIRFTASQPVYAAFHFYEMSVNLNSIAAVQTAGLPSGSVFPIGTTLNTFRAVDQSGNEAFTSFVVEVLDAEKPRMGNYTSVTHQAGASGTWTGSAATIAISDNCGSEILQLTEEYFDQRGNRFYQGQSPVAQGNLVLGNRSFPVGANTVVVSIRDAAGNISDRARFNVSITDITAPTIVVSGNMTQTADPGVCAAWVKVPIPVTADNCSVQSVANSFNGSPSAAGRYPVGTTVVTWTVTDGSGNKTTAVQTITVIDTELPVLINVPVSMIQTNDAGTCGAVVTWDAVRATDNCGLRSFVSDHQSGEIFPLGETVVTFTATDRNGNVGTSSFTITVKDNEAPKVITRPVTVTLVNGSATILPSAINNGSTDNCGAVTLSASKTVFNCADVGINRVTLTVTDVNNNTSSGIALVTVIGETPTSRITVVPSNSTYTGGVPTDIYLGYGPQSVTLSTTVTGTVPVSYNWTGSSGLSCTTCANPVFTPTAAGSYRFTVVATNSYGCTTTSSVTICVRDIRVPSSNGRVYVCHTDLGTGTITTVDMATNTVANYLLQNPQDKLGSCGMAPCSQVVVTSSPDIPKTMTPAVVDKMSKETMGVTETGLSVKASPNPTRDVFTFIVTSAGKLPVHIRLLNEAGQMQESRNNIQLGSAFTMGRSLHSGVYFAEVIQGKERVVVKLIKMIR